jgi:hypothetical protein
MEENKMAKTCNGCGTEKSETMQNVMVPYAVVELVEARQKWLFKRMWIALIVAWSAVLAIVGIFTYERLQYDYTGTYEEIIVDAEDNGNANYIGQDGNIYNGENNSEENNKNP